MELTCSADVAHSLALPFFGCRTEGRREDRCMALLDVVAGKRKQDKEEI